MVCWPAQHASFVELCWSGCQPSRFIVDDFGLFSHVSFDGIQHCFRQQLVIARGSGRGRGMRMQMRHNALQPEKAGWKRCVTLILVVEHVSGPVPCTDWRLAALTAAPTSAGRCTRWHCSPGVPKGSTSVLQCSCTISSALAYSLAVGCIESIRPRARSMPPARAAARARGRPAARVAPRGARTRARAHGLHEVRRETRRIGLAANHDGNRGRLLSLPSLLLMADDGGGAGR